MAFWENFPWTNYNNINLDEILKKMDKCEALVVEYKARLDEFEGKLDIFDSDLTFLRETVSGIEVELSGISGDILSLGNRVGANEDDITSITGRLGTVEETLSGIPAQITALSSRIDTVESDSVTRDNNLSNRVSLLESAVINPVDVYNSSENLIMGGDYLLDLTSDQINAMCIQNDWKYDHGFYCDNASQYLQFRTQGIMPIVSNRLTFPVSITLAWIPKNLSTDPYRVCNPDDIIYKTIVVRESNQYAPVNPPGHDYPYAGISQTGYVTIYSYNGSDMTNTYRLVGVKAERGDTPSGLTLCRRDQLLMAYAKKYTDDHTGGSSPVHYTGSVEFDIGTLTTDPQLTWLDSPYMTAGIDVYKDGNIVSGKLSLELGSGTSEAITMTDLVTTPKTIDVSSLQLPKASVTGQPIGSYVDVVNRIQYIVYATNGSTYLSSLTLYPFFVSSTTSASGHIVDIPINYPC